MESLEAYDTKFRGLENKIGKNNCFLNVVIQSLWHLISFRINFLQFKNHRHSDKELFLRYRRTIMIRERKNSIQEEETPQVKNELKNNAPDQLPPRKRTKSFDDQEESKEGRNYSQDALNLLGPEWEQLIIEAKKPIRKETIKAVKQSEICLFCNLQDLFTKYEFDDKEVLQPKNVRQSLEQIFFEQNADFSDGKMGCAQETLDDILSYLHREYVFPNYLEQYLLVDNDQRFKMDNDLDDHGCSPKCPAHQTFGIEICEITSCSKCQVAEEINQIKREFAHQLYVEELFSTMETYKTGYDLGLILQNIIKGEADFHLQYQTPTMCQNCKIPLQIQKRWLLESPNIYTFNFQYDYTQQPVSRTLLDKLFRLIPYKIDLRDFLSVGDKKADDTTYVIRGMITFYGKHYIAYFYSQRFDTWAQFNDENIKSIGNFKEVITRCISGKQRVVTVFYERSDIIVNVINTQDLGSPSPKKKEKRKIYFTDKNIKKNNFWDHSAKDKGCNIFQ